MLVYWLVMVILEYGNRVRVCCRQCWFPSVLWRAIKGIFEDWIQMLLLACTVASLAMAAAACGGFGQRAVQDGVRGSFTVRGSLLLIMILFRVRLLAAFALDMRCTGPPKTSTVWALRYWTTFLVDMGKWPLCVRVLAKH